MSGRGALLVLEGCDRVGKSTQAKLLVEALNSRNIKTIGKSFPNRKIATGVLLSKFLKKEIELPSEAAHLLFSANRWECKKDMVKALMDGTTLVVDRYAMSGAAYTSAATGRSLDWCQEADRGLPAPDLVIYLKHNDRINNPLMWDGERYDNIVFQEKVSCNYEKLNDGTWKILNCEQDIHTIHKELLEAALDVIKLVKYSDLRQL